MQVKVQNGNIVVVNNETNPFNIYDKNFKKKCDCSTWLSLIKKYVNNMLKISVSMSSDGKFQACFTWVRSEMCPVAPVTTPDVTATRWEVKPQEVSK